MRSSLAIAFVAGLLLAFAPATYSGTVLFDFEDQVVGTNTPFAITKGGLTASFNTPGVPGSFEITTSIWAPPIVGKVLFSPGSARLLDLPLVVEFSQSLDRIQLDFSTNDFGSPGPLEISAYRGGTTGTLVATTQSVGSVPVGFLFPQGSIQLTGAGLFDTVVVSAPQSPFFAIDNILVQTALMVIPEPRSIVMATTAATCLMSIWLSGLSRWRKNGDRGPEQF